MKSPTCNPSTTVDLCGTWQFRPDPHGDGEKLGFWQPRQDAESWGEVHVPSVFDHAAPALDGYQGVIWYRRRFRAPDELAGKRIVLHFEAVNYVARVWLDDRFLGEHRDAFLPFEFEVGDWLTSGTESVLTVSVDNAPYPGDVPADQVQWRGFGGILREVSLRITDPLHIQAVAIDATPRRDGGCMSLETGVGNDRSMPVEALLETRVTDPDGKQVLHLTSRATLQAGDSVMLQSKAELTAVQAWSPATPALYTADICLRDATGPVGRAIQRFGFRKIEAFPDGLRLNGQPLFLTGFNRHEDSPRTAAAVDHETTRRDLEHIKAAGANFVRLCHYPHHPRELAMCDEIGLLALAEIPLNLHVDDARAKTAERQLRVMIRRDRNHPCVIFWSVGNESHEENPRTAQINRDLIRVARKLDPSRLCVHVSHRWEQHPNFAEDDVICINNYPSIESWVERCGRNPELDVNLSRERWRKTLNQLHAQYPEKPILITEFGYPALAGTRGHALGEDMQEKVIRAEFPAFDAPFLCGVSCWCWADHAWPPGLPFHKLTDSPFGLHSRTRNPKPALALLSSLYHEKQSKGSCP